jgi:hypothetical protein
MRRATRLTRAADTAGAVCLLMLTITSAVSAQSDHLLAAGAGVSATRVNGGPWDRSPDYFIFRLPRPERFGLSWNIGTDSFPVPETATPSHAIGSLRVHHFLFGPGYTWRRGAVEVTGSALVGPSTRSFRLDAGAAADGPTLSSRWSFSEMADLTAWIDLGRWFGIKASVDYLFDRPTLVSSADGQETVWKARRLHTQIGLVVGIY